MLLGTAGLIPGPVVLTVTTVLLESLPDRHAPATRLPATAPPGDAARSQAPGSEASSIAPDGLPDKPFP